MAALAIFDGFWGQIFEYWPFFLTVGATILFGGIAVGADMWWRRVTPPPQGAAPRVAIAVDPRVPFRRWVSRGRTLLRFGCGIGIIFGFVYASFAISPQGLNDQFGLTQQRDNALAAGAIVALAALMVGYLATVYLRDKPWVQFWVIVAVPVLAMVGPWAATGDITKLYASAGVVGAPTLFIIVGLVYTWYGLRGLQGLQRAEAGAANAG